MVAIGGSGRVERPRTTHWTEARVSLDFIVKLWVPALFARSVNSSVRSLKGLHCYSIGRGRKMDSLTVTIVGGVVVVVIGLFIEYGIIQRRKKIREENLSLHNDAQVKPQLNDNSRISLPEVSGTTATDLPWPKAINKAVDEFRSLHKGKTVEVVSTNADGRFAMLLVAVYQSGYSGRKYYSLAVNKLGEILSITQSD
jgi:hypothetical protein